MTVAAFMDLALYHPELGYYARADQRSGRAGDFFTSVDVGPLFGELLAIQLAEMSRILAATQTAERAAPADKHQQQDPAVSAGGASSAAPGTSAAPASTAVASFDLIESGAGNGRLSADILRAAREREGAFYDSVRLHLVEASAAARAAQRATLGDVSERLASSSASLPSSFEGVLIANELLDALPTHQVVMREQGLREVYVSAPTPTHEGHENTEPRNQIALEEGPPSTPDLAEYLARVRVRLEPGWRAEINLRAAEWIRDVARRLRRGFIILIDYGHEARELYSPTHAGGTLTTFSGHRSEGPESAFAAEEDAQLTHLATAPWLQAPGEQDITAHVDFTSVRAAAEEEGLQTLGFLDQTYFLLGLVGDDLRGFGDTPGAHGAPAITNAPRARALKTLIMPGGLGSTMKVLILGTGVGTPALRGCSFRMRVT